MLLSEVAPNNAWIELYNAHPITQTIRSMYLDDGFAITASFTLTDVVIAPHGFYVIDAEAVRQFEPGTLELLGENGSIVDAMTYTEISDGTTWSRYPVQGGGWQANTPPTPGDFNLPAPDMPTATPIEATSNTAPDTSPQPVNMPVDETPQDEVALPRWAPIVLVLAGGLVVWLLVAGRPAPPPLQ